MNKEVTIHSNYVVLTKIIFISFHFLSMLFTELGFPDEDDLATGMWKKEIEWRAAGNNVRVTSFQC